MLPLEAGLERTLRPWGAFGFNGEETKLAENERVGGFDGGDSGARRGWSKFEVVGVRAWKLSSGLLEPLGMLSPSSLDVGHGFDIAEDAQDDERRWKGSGEEMKLVLPWAPKPAVTGVTQPCDKARHRRPELGLS